MKTLLAFIVTAPLLCGAATFTEDFTGLPTNWLVYGNASLFASNTNAHALDVTWDSREPNSILYHRLGNVLTRHDDFAFEFDLTLHDIEIGMTPERPYTFEVAVGLINVRNATAPAFIRGQFSGTRNIVEFDYFPTFSSFGATVAGTIVSSNNMFAYGHNFPLEMTMEDLFHVRMDYAASNSTLNFSMTRNGEPFGPLEPIHLSANFSDFRVDAFAISSYSDQQADGSILAHGTVDNIVVVYPEGPITQLVGRLAAGSFEARFDSRTDWTYQLERTSDLTTWTAVGAFVPGTGGELVLSDQAAVAYAFYRVRAERP